MSANGLAMAAMAGWGVAYVPSAWLVESWPPLLAAGARLGLAGVLLLAALRLVGAPLGPRVGIGTVGWLALTQTVLFYGATFYGIAHGGAGLSAVLANTDPLFVAVLAALVLDERLRRLQWLGLALGLAGASLVSWRGLASAPEMSLTALVVVGGALSWAIGTVTVARGLQASARPLALAAWQMAAGGAALALWGLLAEGAPAAAGVRELGLIVGLAALGSAAPLACFYLALARGPAGQVSAWFFLIPAIGVSSAWLLLGEPVHARLGAGLGFVCIGLWLVLRGPRS